jgi:hypothetical protein
VTEVIGGRVLDHAAVRDVTTRRRIVKVIRLFHVLLLPGARVAETADFVD